MIRVSYSALLVFTIFLVISLANSLSLEVVKGQDPKDGDGTRVQLTCFTGNETKTRLHETARIRLLRLDPNQPDTWTNMAVLHYDQSVQTSDVNITASGYSGDVFKSFLTVEWPGELTHLLGRYRCDAVGYTEALDDIVTDESHVVNVTDTSQESHRLFKFLQDSERKMVARVQKMMRGFMNSSISSFLNGLASKLYGQRETTTTQNYNTTNSENIITEENKLWPQGNFTLLMPDTGCPEDPPEWKEALLEMKVENDRKYYPVNSPLRLAPPFTRNGIVYKQVCSLADSSDRKSAWPKGSYCIQTFSLPCPGGFKSSASRFDDQSRDESVTVTASHDEERPEVEFHSSIFCCRHDGSPEDPIVLPTSKPFYLHRHKGECQKVKDMEVTPDLIMVAAVQDSGGELWLSGEKDYLPDVSMGPIKEELCYYL